MDRTIAVAKSLTAALDIEEDIWTNGIIPHRTKRQLVAPLKSKYQPCRVTEQEELQLVSILEAVQEIK